ncbi:interleukin-1 receptor type 1-like isoform X1 [Pseudochaenichthys georgianus]|uniref:interleukin-1 receptor type 1-like isoform X1 n=1 Tax=Pseudochaenichthys georgianus TaxID=52239 RepID=UPI00146C9DE1|nr:interleukin-1 receptor type 1-like isoform X1 [Pseudochaenichthys georgianus]XP_033965773.1 interleukin-1 receptor type 1-like isoform X1 [Pseudochaenichthys georgianus]XP_033965775.1 interleukin-1 receptor type 1-like isoform X1 [Pseudochaenichthys georgianus]
MGRWSTLGGSLLFFLGLSGTCTGFEQENCTNYRLQFDRVYSVPGEVAMLNTTLASYDVFNISAVPYNITWYDSKTRQEISNETGRTAVRGETLWFLNTTLDDDGEYVSVLRTRSGCYRQNTRLIVELPVPGECGRPRKAGQPITKGVTDYLGCPLKEYISKLNSYNTTFSLMWYKGCVLIVDGSDGYSYEDNAKLKIDKVETTNQQSYTCTLTFTLDGTVGSVSESIEAWVNAKYSLTPQVRQPAGGIIKAPIGSTFSQLCQVFVPCVGKPWVNVFWFVQRDFIMETNPSARVYTSEKLTRSETVPVEGVWIERVLTISKLQEKDYNINYTCKTASARGNPQSYFTLLPTDPDLRLPIGMILGNVAVLFIVSVILYYLFKVDIVLCFRRMFPVFYTNTDSDGKLYDAYVAYSQPNTEGFSNEVEAFVFHTLPEVLEKACGYKLFLAGRDCVPGMAIVDSVEENIQASRRLLLLYTASTFMRKRLTSGISSNNNITKSRDSTEHSESKKESDRSSNTSFDGGEENYPDSRQQLERLAAMHRSLLEGSLKVILVELEEITPAQLALFPESVRHLRMKQGAVCWWKNQSGAGRWRTCMRTKEDEEKGGQLSQTLSPSSRFWKEMRYRMPVKGKRAMCPEKATLLNV